MDKKLTTRQEYDEAKAIVEALIAEATEKGMLEPEMDNEYTRRIAELSKLMAKYEDEYMDILPLREKTPLIRCIEDYFYALGQGYDCGVWEDGHCVLNVGYYVAAGRASWGWDETFIPNP